MTFKPFTYYKCVCDRCGCNDSDDSLYSAWSDTEGAWWEAECSDWAEIDDKHYCPDCWECDEDGEAIIKEDNS
jgi:hypothetical protein